MGLFDFFRRDAGPKVGQGDTPTPDDLKQHLAKTGLNAASYDIQVNGDTVTVRGSADSREEKEKVALALGNVHGIGKVDDQIGVASGGNGAAPADAPVPGSGSMDSRFYTVEPGDTLSKIAKQFYGNANAYQRIFEANRPMLQDPDRIYPGQALRIPPQ